MANDLFFIIIYIFSLLVYNFTLANVFYLIQILLHHISAAKVGSFSDMDKFFRKKN